MIRTAMRRLGAVIITLLTCFALLVSGTSAAAAGVKDHKCDRHGQGDHWKKPKSTGNFEPAPADDFTHTFRACGRTVTVKLGDRNGVVGRVTPQKDGSVYEEYKGRLTVDVTAPGKRMLDELDNSGPYTFLTKPDGSSSLLTVRGPSLIYPFTDSEAAIFKAAGLPQGFYFTSGKLVAIVDQDFFIVKIIIKPRHLTNICDLLKPRNYT
jgi:hypothetical protein